MPKKKELPVCFRWLAAAVAVCRSRESGTNFNFCDTIYIPCVSNYRSYEFPCEDNDEPCSLVETSRPCLEYRMSSQMISFFFRNSEAMVRIGPRNLHVSNSTIQEEVDRTNACMHACMHACMFQPNFLPYVEPILHINIKTALRRTGKKWFAKNRYDSMLFRKIGCLDDSFSNCFLLVDTFTPLLHKKQSAKQQQIN
jgi:hypothetical protein